MNKDLKIRHENLEKQMINLAKRQDYRANKNERHISETKADIQNISDEVIANAGTFADFMEEYYMSQLSDGKEL